jgi:hypothetical protein
LLAGALLAPTLASSPQPGLSSERKSEPTVAEVLDETNKHRSRLDLLDSHCDRSYVSKLR